MERQAWVLVREAPSSGTPEEISPKVRKPRQEHAGRIEALLSDAQRKRWRELLGQAPFSLD
jgi:hypothetical protein